MPGDYCTAHLPRRSRTSDPIPRSRAILDFTAERVFQTAELYNQLNGTGGGCARAVRMRDKLETLIRYERCSGVIRRRCD